MRLCEEVRVSCAAIAESARDVAIDLSRVGEIKAGPEPELDPERHYLEGSAEDVALFTLTLDAINFGSGWFPTLRKRPGCSGYNTIAWALTDRFRADGPWSADELSALRAETVADVLGQERGHELACGEIAECAKNHQRAWIDADRLGTRIAIDRFLHERFQTVVAPRERKPDRRWCHVVATTTDRDGQERHELEAESAAGHRQPKLRRGSQNGSRAETS